MAHQPIARRNFLLGAGTAAAGLVPVASAQAQAPTSSGAADVILRNGRIVTVDAAFTHRAGDRRRGRSYPGGRRRAPPMAAHIGPQTRAFDLAGRTVMPGLIDGHAHMDREGLKDVYPSLGRVRSIRDIQDRIADLARTAKPGEWIVTMPIGDAPYYWDVPDILAEKRWPTRHDLDAAAPNNPVFIRSIWGFWRHTLPLVSCANARRPLRLAGHFARHCLAGSTCSRSSAIRPAIRPASSSKTSFSRSRS